MKTFTIIPYLDHPERVALRRGIHIAQSEETNKYGIILGYRTWISDIPGKEGPQMKYCGERVYFVEGALPGDIVTNVRADTNPDDNRYYKLRAISGLQDQDTSRCLIHLHSTHPESLCRFINSKTLKMEKQLFEGRIVDTDNKEYFDATATTCFPSILLAEADKTYRVRFKKLGSDESSFNFASIIFRDGELSVF